MSCLIDLLSADGQRLLTEVKQDGVFHQPFIGQIFRKQEGRHNCALQSAALVLNASYLAKRSPTSCNTDNRYVDDMPKCTVAQQLPFAEERMLVAEATRAVTSLDRVNRCGATLEELYHILTAYGCKVDRHHATESSVESFREMCKTALSTTHSGVIVNYHMGTLGQGMFVGHHSPLGAYHPREDRFLLWDTWPETEVCWAKADDLFRAMNSVDSESNKSRGFCIVDTTNVADETPN